MARRSLFSFLSEQPWWVSLLVAALMFAVVDLVFPPFAFFVALPFALVAVYFLYRQIRRGSPVNVPERLAALRDMPWENFSLLVEEAYRRQRYTVESSKHAAFDFMLRKGEKSTLVQCRRWKVNQIGAGPLAELHEAALRLGAFDSICIGTGVFSDKAREYAADKRITLVTGPPLVELIGILQKRRWKWLPF